MLKNFLITAFRSLVKQRFFTLINILGLALGIACCILIGIYIRHELSYDRFHAKADRTYRVVANIKFGEAAGEAAAMPPPFAKVAMQDFPEVEMVTRVQHWGPDLVKKDNGENIRVQKVAFVDPNFFDVFDIEVLAGNPQEGLKEKNTMVITKRVADMFFPDGDAVGKILTVAHHYDQKVVAVIADHPSTTHLSWELIRSINGLDWADSNNWLGHSMATYLVLKKGADPEALEAKFPQMIETYAGPMLKQYLASDIEDWVDAGNYISYRLQPLEEMHLYSNDIQDGMAPEAPGDINYVVIFSIIAGFILLIACINFMNLSTARSTLRAKEVGVRKVLGSAKQQLMGQFLTESTLLSVAAFGLAIVLAELIRPFFNDVAQKNLSIPFGDPWFWLLIAGGAVVVGLLAGLYPAAYLSNFRPVEVLKGRFASRQGGKYIRSGLVVFQFAISIMLIVGTVMVYRQLQYIQHKKLGFEKDRVVVLQDTYTLDENDRVYALKKELQRLPGVKSVTVSAFLPVPSFRQGNPFWLKEKRAMDQTVLLQSWAVDHDYVSTLGMEIIAGRDFSIELASDSQAVILNEQAAKQFGFGKGNLEDALGAEIQTTVGYDEALGQEILETWKVIGVIKNFHYESFRQGIQSLGLLIGRSVHNVTIKLNSDDLPGTLDGIKKVWSEFMPNQAIDYSFLDDRFNRMYEEEQRLGKIVGAFSLLAIVVACLGLFALSTFTAERRAKEIGIRKVLGANVRQIIWLLSTEYARLIAIALVISIPLSWWLTRQWLLDFTYRIDMNWEIFLLAGVIAFIIAGITISWQSIRAAVSNPVDSLRDE